MSLKQRQHLSIIKMLTFNIRIYLYDILYRPRLFQFIVIYRAVWNLLEAFYCNNVDYKIIGYSLCFMCFLMLATYCSLGFFFKIEVLTTARIFLFKYFYQNSSLLTNFLFLVVNIEEGPFYELCLPFNGWFKLSVFISVWIFTSYLISRIFLTAILILIDIKIVLLIHALSLLGRNAPHHETC